MIELILTSEGKRAQSLSLFFRPFKTEIAREYLLALKVYSGAEDAVLEPDRTYNFPGDRRGRAWIAQRLNNCIDAINKYSPGLIRHRAKPRMDQTLMNHLHHDFEKYRGSVNEPAEFFLKAPYAVQDALHEMNILIHRYEDVCRNEADRRRGRPASPRIVATFKAFQRAGLEEGDFKHFTKREVFGRWYIDYCELGKPLWDVFQDKDEVVGDENIRPLRYFSANALVHFGRTNSPTEVSRQLREFNRWWDEKEEFLKSLGFKKGDPKNSIGHIPVADLCRNRGAIKGLSQSETVKLIGKYPRIKGVIVHD